VVGEFIIILLLIPCLYIYANGSPTFFCHSDKTRSAFCFTNTPRRFATPLSRGELRPHPVASRHPSENHPRNFQFRGAQRGGIHTPACGHPSQEGNFGITKNHYAKHKWLEVNDNLDRNCVLYSLYSATLQPMVGVLFHSSQINGRDGLYLDTGSLHPVNGTPIDIIIIIKNFF